MGTISSWGLFVPVGVIPGWLKQALWVVPAKLATLRDGYRGRIRGPIWLSSLLTHGPGPLAVCSLLGFLMCRNHLCLVKVGGVVRTWERQESDKFYSFSKAHISSDIDFSN